MLEIRMQLSRNRAQLTMSGHAGYAPKGHDLVCAAASTMLMAGMISLNNQTRKETNVYYDDPGEMGITQLDCGPCEQDMEKVMTIYRTMACGFEALAFKYPENVDFEMIDY